MPIKFNAPRRRVAAYPASLFFLIVVLVATIVQPSTATQAQSTGKPTATITGFVRDSKTHAGIAGATVQIGAFSVFTDAPGRIPATSLPLDGPVLAVDVEVQAQGYGSWRYVGVELSSEHPVELRVELGREPVVFEQQAQGSSSTLSPYDGPPEYINVGRTFDANCVYPPTNVQRVDRMLFKDYVRSVLPNEWVASWPAASLDAGAVAVSQYAWSVAFFHRKWTGRGYTFDVLDSTCDQVYKDRNPSLNYTATDAAVERMWGVALLRTVNQTTKLITTYYRAYDSQCGTTADCMGQWGSFYRARDYGERGVQILHHYYDPVEDVQTISQTPQHDAEVVSRSPDVKVWPGQSKTLAVCLRNTGTLTWQRGVTNLGTVDPDNAQSLDYATPFANSTWLNQYRPAALTQRSVAPGEHGVWSFSVAAPSSLVPGTYKLAVQPVQDGVAWLSTDQPIIWNVTVTTPPEGLTYRVWLPMATGESSDSACS